MRYRSALWTVLTVFLVGALVAACAPDDPVVEPEDAVEDPEPDPDPEAEPEPEPEEPLEPVAIRFAYIPDAAVGPLVAIANEHGIWEEYGLDIELIEFTTGPDQVVAMEAGSVDAGFLGPGAMWLPAVGRVQVLSINLLDLGNQVIAHPDSGATSMEDLAGMTVGVPEGTSGEMILRQALGAAGMSLDDIEKVNMDPASLVPAFIGGSVDAAAIWYPPAGTIFAEVPDAVRVASDEDFFPDLAPLSAFIASQEAIDDNPEGLRRLIRALMAANDYRLDNLDEAITLTSQFIGLDEAVLVDIMDSDWLGMFHSSELVANTEDGTIYEWLDGRAQLFVDIGTIDEALPATEFYAGDLFLEAMTG